jgi:alpha-glucosidase
VSDGGHVWWEDAVLYEVYPRSFADADGDGVGDLPGLRSRLGYLADLGVDAVWLTPFYPSPLADGGYDVSDYCAVDPLLGTMADFDGLVKDAAGYQIRVIVDLVPNHCSSAHPLFRAALAAAPGSPERARFFFRDGRGPRGEQPPNNWPSQFGGSAWTRVTEADGRHHEKEGARTAIGEVWYDVPETLTPYLDPGGLPQVFNFQLILAGWRAAEFRAAIDSALALTGGSRAPWVIGNHDVARPASRYRLDEGFTPQTVSRLIALGDQNAETGARRARAAALVLLALPGSAYIYQGEELGLPEVTGIPDDARQDPRFSRTRGEYPGRDGCRVPIPWSRTGTGFGFSLTSQGGGPAGPWLPEPAEWGRYSVESQFADEHSTLNLYRAALRLRRDHPALARTALRWTPCRR